MTRVWRTRARGLVAVLSAGLLAATACTGDPTPTPGATAVPSPAATAAATASPAPSGVFRVGILQDITTTNLWAVYGPAPSVFNLYALGNQYPTLYTLSTVNRSWIPAWAEGFPSPFVQEGNLWTTTVTLKQGASWSDGKPVTADDVAFTVNTVLGFEIPGVWEQIYDRSVLQKAEAIDQRTVKFFFTAQPGLAQWEYGTSLGVFAAKHYWEPKVAEAKKKATLEQQQEALLSIEPAGEPSAGEMMLVKWEQGAFVELKANPRFLLSGSRLREFKEGAVEVQRPGSSPFTAYGEAKGDVVSDITFGPYVGSAIYKVYANQNAGVLALQADEIDFLVVPGGLEGELRRQVERSRETRIITNAPNRIRYLGFNMRKAPMNNKAFRQAVALLIDKEFVAGTLLGGSVAPAYSVVPDGNQQWHNDSLSELGKGIGRQERITEAVRVLKAAGFKWDVEPAWDAQLRDVKAGSGLKGPDGTAVPELQILAPTTGYDPARATFAVWTERWLRDAGIPVRLVLSSNSAIQNQVFGSQDVDMWVLGWTLSDFPTYLADFFHSSSAVQGGTNAGGYSNPEYDRVAEELMEERDLSEARAKASRLQQILADDLPYIVLFTPQIAEPVRSDVHLPTEAVLDGVQVMLGSSGGLLSTVKVD